jgi:hypothetical protein
VELPAVGEDAFLRLLALYGPNADPPGEDADAELFEDDKHHDAVEAEAVALVALQEVGLGVISLGSVKETGRYLTFNPVIQALGMSDERNSKNSLLYLKTLQEENDENDEKKDKKKKKKKKKKKDGEDGEAGKDDAAKEDDQASDSDVKDKTAAKSKPKPAEAGSKPKVKLASPTSKPSGGEPSGEMGQYAKCTISPPRWLCCRHQRGSWTPLRWSEKPPR